MQPSGWPEVEKTQNRSSEKAGCFSNVTWLDKYYVIYESIKKNSRCQKATLNHWHTTLHPKTIFFHCQPTNSPPVLTVAVRFGLLHHQLQQKLYRPRHPCIHSLSQASVRYMMKTMGCTGKAMAITLETLLWATVNWLEKKIISWKGTTGKSQEKKKSNLESTLFVD